MRAKARQIIELTLARCVAEGLLLVLCLKTVFANALALLGVASPEWMEIPAEAQ